MRLPRLDIKGYRARQEISSSMAEVVFQGTEHLSVASDALEIVKVLGERALSINTHADRNVGILCLGGGAKALPQGAGIAAMLNFFHPQREEFSANMTPLQNPEHNLLNQADFVFGVSAGAINLYLAAHQNPQLMRDFVSDLRGIIFGRFWTPVNMNKLRELLLSDKYRLTKEKLAQFHPDLFILTTTLDGQLHIVNLKNEEYSEERMVEAVIGSAWIPGGIAQGRRIPDRNGVIHVDGGLAAHWPDETLAELYNISDLLVLPAGGPNQAAVSIPPAILRLILRPELRPLALALSGHVKDGYDRLRDPSKRRGKLREARLGGIYTNSDLSITTNNQNIIHSEVDLAYGEFIDVFALVIDPLTREPAEVIS